ncbi:MAG: hypothetical protein JW716_00880 [Candidatus Aenigmarchaeota archaeon]|nr:hypothetical protein [Candidatus Aenigmarchaeota archaeon]
MTLSKEDIEIIIMRLLDEGEKTTTEIEDTLRKEGSRSECMDKVNFALIKLRGEKKVEGRFSPEKKSMVWKKL